MTATAIISALIIIMPKNDADKLIITFPFKLTSKAVSFFNRINLYIIIPHTKPHVKTMSKFF